MPRGRPDYYKAAADVYLRPLWAEKERLNKHISVGGTNKAYGESASTFYIVPTGKTLYIWQISAYCHAYAAADGDANQICHVEVFAPDVITWQLMAGGNGGLAVPLSQPIRISAGGMLTLTLYNWGNHAVNMLISARGYEE